MIVFAEVTLAHASAGTRPTPIDQYGFIVQFDDESFSAQVLPSGTAHLHPGRRATISLHFLVDDALAAVMPGRRFTFFEGAGRYGDGVFIESQR